MTDVVQFFLQREIVETFERKAEKQTDSPIKKEVSVPKGSLDIRFAAANRRRIGYTPVCRHWLSRPYRADFIGCVVTDGEDKIESRCAGL